MKRDKFGSRNAVRGRPGWYYGLLVMPPSGEDAPCRFSVFHADSGACIHNLHGSRYRTSTLARSMGDKRPGYEHVARVAISRFNERRTL